MADMGRNISKMRDPEAVPLPSITIFAVTISHAGSFSVSASKFQTADLADPQPPS